MVAEVEKTAGAPGVAVPEATPSPPVEPVAPAAPQLDLSPVLEDMKSLDSKGLKEKYPDLWGAVRPHIDREVQVNRKNLEKQYADNVERTRAAQQVVAWYQALTPMQKVQVLENPEQAERVHTAQRFASTAASQSEERLGEKMLANAKAQLKERWPDIDLDTNEETLAAAIEKGFEQMEKDIMKRADERVEMKLKTLLSEHNISSPQPPRVQAESGASGTETDDEFLARYRAGEEDDHAQAAKILARRASTEPIHKE